MLKYSITIMFLKINDISGAIPTPPIAIGAIGAVGIK